MQDFMQFGFSEEASELVNDFLDFGGTCMRPTGELYGISGGKCRKGTETAKKINEPLRAYVKMMKEAKERGKPEDTSEYHGHHSFPRSIFKESPAREKRLVWLTHKEHYLAHQKLYDALRERYGDKDIRTIKMGYAIGMMAAVGKNKGGVKDFLSPEEYDNAMKAKRLAQSNGMFINNGVTNKMVGKKDEIPEGWTKGALKTGVRYNNGVKDLMVKAGELVPPGFVQGGKPTGPRSEEFKNKMTEIQKGIPETPEARKNMGEGQKKRFENPEEREKRADQAREQLLKGGMPQVEIMRARNKELNKDPEHRLKYGTGVKGKTWYKKGKEEHRFDKHPGEGWEEGRTLKLWWNNGKSNKYSAEKPEGDWSSGMLRKNKQG